MRSRGSLAHAWKSLMLEYASSSSALLLLAVQSTDREAESSKPFTVLSEGQLHRVAAVKPKEAAKTEPF
eukprot:13472-Heterococcus_DN1.PRE.3